MDFDPVVLARAQFALTIMFHYIFPPFTIGLGWLLVGMEAMHLKTGDELYHRMARFWTKIFAVNFALGVATGIVMEFQFGTNWSSYSRVVGDVFGSALAAEGIFAFFLESGFLAVLVYGWDKVSKRAHFISTVLVALGATFSAVWIIAANSWMQTPAGFHLVAREGGFRAEVVDFWQVVFNPSTLHRLVHTTLGALLQGAFLVASVSAWYLLKRRHEEFARRSLAAALMLGGAAALVMPFSGHMQAQVVAQLQPAKLAAFEGLFTTSEGGTAMALFGIPDREEKRLKAAVLVPGLLSLLAHNDRSVPVVGLDRFPEADWPPVAPSYWSFHIMLWCGGAALLLALAGLAQWWRGRLSESPALLWLLVFGVGLPVIANQAGWTAAEVGRQPWIVYGIMRTSEGVSRAVSSSQLVGSIAAFVAIYTLLFALWLYVLDDKIRHGPDEDHAGERRKFLEVAAARADPGGPTMTGAKGE